MDVPKTFNDLLKDVLRQIFLQLSASSYICKEITSTADLHHEYDMLIAFKVLIQTYYIDVACPPEDVELLHHLPFGRFLIEELLIDRL